MLQWYNFHVDALAFLARLRGFVPFVRQRRQKGYRLLAFVHESL